MPTPIKRAVLIVAGWAVAGVFLATQHHLILTAPAVDVPQRLSDLIVVMAIWMVLTPVVLRIAERFPLSQPRRLRNLGILVGIGLAFAAGRAAIDLSLPLLLHGELHTAQELRHGFLLLLHPHFLFFAMIIGIAHFVRLQREAEERRRREAHSEADLAKAHLRRLRADLQPHFLFNTLNAIAALVHTDPDAAERTLATLSDLLRRSLESGDRLEVSVAEDLDFIERYLDVQRMRFGGRLRARVEAERDAMEALIPPLLLQPLVENAIVHGVAPRADGGGVTVRVFRDGDDLRLQVRDDGPGSDETALFRGDSIGVPNTKARLEFLYGARQSLAFRREGGEFVVDVRIPFHRTAVTLFPLAS
ncbi:MAG TPA: histidine kinase [Thermoanaerobaculia bacterium]|nr:histidine kinase [Thermoanaerobaculia bacterium]